MLFSTAAAPFYTLTNRVQGQACSTLVSPVPIHTNSILSVPCPKH